MYIFIVLRDSQVAHHSCIQQLYNISLLYFANRYICGYGFCTRFKFKRITFDVIYSSLDFVLIIIIVTIIQLQ